MGNCKASTEVYSRVVGITAVQQWNLGKQAEFHDRVPYAVPGGFMSNTEKSAHPSTAPIA